jgi:broad specificity phosphatase PhoE
VRHGESEYNAACGAPGSSWDDPIIWDAPLSALGRSQASALGPTLLGRVSPNALWVASPLTRAIETCMLARGALLRADAQRFPEPSQEQPWMVVRSELSEHLITSGDVGRPASTLAASFPELAAATFEHLPDTWWYCPGHGKVNCGARGLLQASEPRAELQRRIGAFRKWACARPEREMVVFGHSTFFKYFTNSEGRLKNCEVLTFTL